MQSHDERLQLPGHGEHSKHALEDDERKQRESEANTHKSLPALVDRDYRDADDDQAKR
jgi:hypothetical protein